MLAVLFAAGCSADRGPESPADDFGKPTDIEVIVTVKQAEDGTVYFQRSDSECLFPSAGYPFTSQERIMASLTVYSDVFQPYGHRADVNWTQPLLQGETLFQYADKSSFTDGLDIADDWITSVVDGYLTVHYQAWWGFPSEVRHQFMVTLDDDSYDVYLYHDAAGEPRDQYTDGIVYFDINALPDTGDGYKTLTLHWTDTRGQSLTRRFEFKTRK